MSLMVDQIISGGQTGADRGGLDAAIELGIEQGGFCPAGRKAEDGRVPKKYDLDEHHSPDYPPRTKLNISLADATVVFTQGPLSGGSKLTVKSAKAQKKLCVHYTLDKWDEVLLAEDLGIFLKKHSVKVLNVAGSRESKAPGIQKAVRHIVAAALRNA